MGAMETSLASRSAIVGELFRANIRSPESIRPHSRPRKLRSSDVKFTSPVMRDDWNLIRQAVVGNPEAQERLFKTYTPRLHRTVFAILRNKEDAEDAVQESWCKAYANLESFEGRSAFSTWLTRIAINSALMLRRRKSFRLEASLNEILDNQPEQIFQGTVSQPPNPEEMYAASELNALIEDQIRELTPRVQSAFRLREIEEFSITEAVQALGIREPDLTGAFCTSRGEREFTRRMAGYAHQEVQSRTDRDDTASDRSRNCERKAHPASLQGS